MKDEMDKKGQELIMEHFSRMVNRKSNVCWGLKSNRRRKYDQKNRILNVSHLGCVK